METAGIIFCIHVYASLEFNMAYTAVLIAHSIKPSVVLIHFIVFNLFRLWILAHLPVFCDPYSTTHP